MSTSTVNDPTPAPRPQEPHPERPIQPTGDLSERNALIQAGQVRHLTDDERMRLAALSWTPDQTLDHARIVAERFPDLLGLLKVNPAVMAEYARIRSAAQAAGRFVPEPDADTLEAADAAAAELRAIAELTPPNVKDVDRRGRAAFAAAIATDWTAGMDAWRAWLGELADVDAFRRREAQARGNFGLANGWAPAAQPRFDVELPAAVGGSQTWRGRMPTEPGDMVPVEPR